jgi:protein-tyrosine phosphatase
MEASSITQPISIPHKIMKGLRIIAGRLRDQGVRTTWLWFTERTTRISVGVSPERTSRVMKNLYIGGQHNRRGLRSMHARGITACIDLRREFGDVEHGLDLERQLSIPTDDDNVPSLEELKLAADFIREALNEGRGVYIHCANGVGRAASTAAAYLITTGLSAQEAWAVIQKARPFIRPTLVQREQIDRFENQFRQN